MHAVVVVDELVEEEVEEVVVEVVEEVVQVPSMEVVHMDSTYSYLHEVG